MLNKHSKQFLKFLRRSATHFENGVVLYAYIYDHRKESIYDIYTVLKHLENQSYIRRSYLGKSPVGVALTELGKHPHQFTIEKVKKLLMKDVIVPIGVSIVTTLITLWLTGQL